MAMSKNNTKKNGRIEYIDPNFIDDNSSYRDIPHPYEDYCIGVEMEVQVPRRDSFGISSKKDTVWSGSTTTFMKGTNGSLTSNYTEITMVNPQNNTVECLGIENIEVSFDAWMHPLVTIKFVDVRAATLFGPQEQGYYNTGKIEQDTGKRTASIYGGSFYKVLFSMPSPLFKLKLKGFYGKPVTLDLAISSYKSNFNSASGCFEMTVTFVGYMYGIYVDLPLSYVVLAPYLSMAENQDWLTNPNFYFRDVTGALSNQRIFTYSELRKLIAEANADIAKLPPGESTAELADIEKEEKAINELASFYKGYLDDIFENGFYVQNYNPAENPENKATYCLAGGFVKKLELKNGSKKEGVTYWIQLKEGGEQTTVEKDVSKHTSELQEKIKQYNDAYSNTLNGFNPNTYLQIGGFNKTDTKAYVLEESGYVSLEDYFSGKYSSKYKSLLGNKFDDYCTDACSKWRKSDSTSVLVFADCDCFNTFGLQLYSRQRELLERKKTLQKEYYKELENKKIDSIGFDYSIGNMYRMLFAHMQTFVSSFYNMLNEAYSERANRTLSAMGVDVNDTDLPRNWKSDNPIPPFTYFYASNDGGRQTIMFPPKSIAETRFINRMVMAAMSFGQEEARVSEYIEKLNKETGDTPQSVVYDNTNYGEGVVKASDYIAITPYDFTVNNPSPYEYLKNNNIQTEFFYQYVFLTFAIRLIYFNIKNNRKPSQTGGNVISDELMSMFGAVEATNFKYGNKEKTKEIITLLEKTYDDFQKYITSKQNETLEFDYPFIGPVLSEKYSNTFEYTFCTGDSKDIVFPISMDDPTQLLKVKFNENNFAYLDNDTGFTSENTWVFVKPDVLSEYSTKASNILTDDSYVDTYKKHIIGNEVEDVSDSILAFPSYVYDGKQYPLYGHRFLYLQNRHKDEETRLYAKAYAFVMGTHGQHYLPSKNYSGVPYLTSLLSILRVGAAQYRYDYIQEHSGNDLIILYENQRHAEPTELYITSDKQGFTILSDKKKSYKKIDSEVAQINSKFAKSAKKVFCNWVTYTFTTINSDLELFDRGEQGTASIPLSDETFEEFLIKSHKEKKRLFTTRWKIGVEDDIYASKDFNIDTKVGAIENLEIDLNKDGDLRDLLTTTYGQFGAINIDFDVKQETHITSAALKKAFNTFIDTLKELYESAQDTETPDYTPMSVSEILDSNMDLKLSIYLTLRNLYDRWFANGKPETWALDVNDSDFNTFKFTNSVFENTYNLMTNVDNINNLVNSYAEISSTLTKETYKNFLTNDSKSVYDLLAHIAQDTGGILMAIPVAGSRDIMNTKNIFAKNIETTFTPYPYNSTPIAADTTYVFMYPQKPSEHLDYDNAKDDDFQYVNDGFDLADSLGEIIELPLIFANESSSSYDVPVFGVSYGRQNQSIFKDISVNMDVPQVTEASIAATLNIASRSGVEPRGQVLYGQDLYKVFSNYAYNCTVEMMGDMQIMPLMYFQLNNIPMFKGVYQIIKVEHSFTPGNATTKFVGVRVNKYQMPVLGRYDVPMFTGDNTAFRDGRNTGIGMNSVGDNFKTYGYIDSKESVDFIRKVYNEIKEGKYDKMSNACKKQTITVGGTGDMSLSKGQTLTASISSNLETLRSKLQPILDAWCEYCVQNKLTCQEVRITSGYRSPEKNSQTKGASSTSQHVNGNAADWQPVQTGPAREIFARFVIAYSLAKNNNFDQIINETSVGVKGSNWTHFGLNNGTGRGEIKNGLVYSNGKSSYSHKLDKGKIIN